MGITVLKINWWLKLQEKKTTLTKREVETSVFHVAVMLKDIRELLDCLIFHDKL